jgi:hypothetical protein
MRLIWIGSAQQWRQKKFPDISSPLHAALQQCR